MTVTYEERMLVKTWLKQAEFAGPVSLQQDKQVRDILNRMVEHAPMPNPDYVSFPALGKMYDIYMRHDDAYVAMREAYRYLYDEYNTPPKPPKAETWVIVASDGRVMGNCYDSREMAEAVVNTFQHNPYRTLRVTKLVEPE